MPRPSKEFLTPSGDNPQPMSSDFLYEVNERLIEWLKQDAMNFDDETSEEETSSDEVEPEHKAYNRFERMAHRLKKWFASHYHHDG
ncbi:hypothetical protein FPANT_11453 [Fusarium pseudoanthophilum]|uniref:Uncharacterized protein n=1 Tax=Fusarium pseudoanthophilum TaxID=48495 RepID=A0A8H5KMU0_9HYPO|nr:hypothetical protein FPANT_11453 [Fusarium pseudoanthophilum]